MARFVSLLKGINVGGKNIIAMKEVVRLHEQLGLSDVRSYLQSGSICFSSQEGDEGKIERKIKAALSEAMGRDISVVIRSGTDMKSILRRNPYPKETEREPNRVFVGFLSAKPTRDAVSVLGEFVSPGERFIVHGTEMYLHLSNGAGNAKLTGAVIERRLKVLVTARNMNTVRGLVELCE